MLSSIILGYNKISGPKPLIPLRTAIQLNKDRLRRGGVTTVELKWASVEPSYFPKLSIVSLSGVIFKYGSKTGSHQEVYLYRKAHLTFGVNNQAKLGCKAGLLAAIIKQSPFN